MQDLNSGDPHEVLQGTKNLPVLISNGNTIIHQSSHVSNLCKPLTDFIEGILPAASVQSAVSRGILAVQQYLNDPEQQVRAWEISRISKAV